HEKKNKYIRVERSYGSYSRSFDLTGIKTDDITASYENGVLTLELPKQDEVKPVSRRLEIK
ncbi:MAG: Hsp20 family protein, partial [Clostridia bacterium]|nr:Hsp20 family protein [Clostridia bacterium]